MRPDFKWEHLNAFRNAVEEEFLKSIMNKPERIPAYEETMRSMREELYKVGLDPADQEQMYTVACTVLMMANFTSAMLMRVCGDPHVMGHLKDTLICMGYHIRDIGFSSGFPEAGNG